MAKINGTNFQVFIPTENVDNDTTSTVWLPVALSNSCTLNISADTPDATTKDSSGWEEVIGGTKSWDVSFDNLVDFAASNDLASGTTGSIQDLFDYLDGRTAIKVAIGVEGTDELYWYGDSFVNNLSITADKESPVSYSGALKGTGALTKGSSATIDDASATYPV